LARVLIVGCGCRGRLLAAALGEAGHAVRGTTRDPGMLRAIEAGGAEAALADPDRLVDAFAGARGGKRAGVADGHSGRRQGGGRRPAWAAARVDRGQARRLPGARARGGGHSRVGAARRGAAAVRRVGADNRMPVEVVEEDPGDSAVWLGAMTTAIERVLAA
jgi:hypothetical protein